MLGTWRAGRSARQRASKGKCSLTPTFAAEGTRFQEDECRVARCRSPEIPGVCEHTAADEIMVATNVYEHAERLRSYERLAGVFELVR